MDKTVEYNCGRICFKRYLCTSIISNLNSTQNEGIKTQTKYESDSLIRFIKEIKKEKNIRVTKRILGIFFRQIQIMKKQLL
jgi:hypothetical protein